MAKFKRITIKRYGNVQITFDDQTKGKKLEQLTKAQAVIEDVFKNLPINQGEVVDYEEMHILADKRVIFVPKVSNDTIVDAIRIEYTKLSTTKINALAKELID